MKLPHKILQLSNLLTLQVKLPVFNFELLSFIFYFFILAEKCPHLGVNRAQRSLSCFEVLLLNLLQLLLRGQY